MIRAEYVHANDREIYMSNIMDDDNAFFESQFNTLAYYDKQRKDILMFESVKDNAELNYITESENNVFTKIGDKIIEILKRTKKFITDTIDKVKMMFTKKENVPKKILAAAKKDPATQAIKVRNLIASGDMCIEDFKSISGFYKEIDDVLAEMKKANADPKSLQGRINKAKDRFDKAAKVAAYGGAFAGSILTIGKICQMISSKKHEELSRDMCKISDMDRKTASNIEEINRRLCKRNSDDNIHDKRTMMGVLAACASAKDRVCNGAISRRTKVLNAFSHMTESIATRLDKNSPLHNTAMKHTVSKMQENRINARHYRANANRMDREIRAKNEAQARRQARVKKQYKLNFDARGNITGKTKTINKYEREA